MSLLKILKTAFFLALSGVVVLFLFLFVGKAAEAENIRWGVNFSAKQARMMSLDPEEVYLSILEELGVKRIKLSTYWDELEPSQGKYGFEELDWYVAEAEERGAQVLIVVGMKTPRWPECHIPAWAQNLDMQQKEQRVNSLVREVVARYGASPAVWGFQIENEPFLSFGRCPPRPKGFLKEKVKIARSLTDKPIVVSDSGEWSFWSRAARLGDLVATTIYRTAWFEELGIYATYPLPPVFYNRKALVVKTLFGKRVICGELQAEPWGPVLLHELPLREQEKTMNKEDFAKTINYARGTGLDEFYLWGAEWWYWMKEKKDNPWFWEQARSLFLENKPVLD